MSIIVVHPVSFLLSALRLCDSAVKSLLPKKPRMRQMREINHLRRFTRAKAGRDAFKRADSTIFSTTRPLKPGCARVTALINRLPRPSLPGSDRLSFRSRFHDLLRFIIHLFHDVKAQRRLPYAGSDQLSPGTPSSSCYRRQHPNTPCTGIKHRPTKNSVFDHPEKNLDSPLALDSYNVERYSCPE